MSHSLGALGRSWCGSAYSADDHEAKRTFHATGRSRMRRLAKLIGAGIGAHDIRSNMGGIAVSGEVTLHTDTLYVQALHSCMGGAIVLVRSCKGRKDYSGGRNHIVRGWDCLDARNPARRMDGPLDCLEALAAYCQAVIKEGT